MMRLVYILKKSFRAHVSHYGIYHKIHTLIVIKGNEIVGVTVLLRTAHHHLVSALEKERVTLTCDYLTTSVRYGYLSASDEIEAGVIAFAKPAPSAVIVMISRTFKATKRRCGKKIKVLNSFFQSFLTPYAFMLKLYHYFDALSTKERKIIFLCKQEHL